MNGLASANPSSLGQHMAALMFPFPLRSEEMKSEEIYRQCIAQCDDLLVHIVRAQRRHRVEALKQDMMEQRPLYRQRTPR